MIINKFLHHAHKTNSYAFYENLNVYIRRTEMTENIFASGCYVDAIPTFHCTVCQNFNIPLEVGICVLYTGKKLTSWYKV